MKVHEFQAKALFRKAGIPVPDGDVAADAAAASAAFTRLGAPLAVVKAQIHAAKALLGKPLVTIQTGPKGQVVQRVLVEAGTEIAHEYYAAITVDRSRGAPVLMVSAEGGMDIEEVARKTPERILREAFDAEAGLRPWQARRLAYALGLPGPAIAPAIDLLRKLARMFLDL
ncbi:MAG TPA: ATP-grasp domain-containing protein, partial [Planctomycetota bacterium]|nr:ATP-grasp domain-containing protein [Planctomycetota bacterium]